MPRYFFHIHDGVSLIDYEGTELPSLHEAYAQAITTAGQFLRDAGIDLLKGSPWRMEVTDAQDQLLLTLHFAAELAPKPLAA